jgi:AraC-like DNA-binding protein
MPAVTLVRAAGLRAFVLFLEEQGVPVDRLLAGAHLAPVLIKAAGLDGADDLAPIASDLLGSLEQTVTALMLHGYPSIQVTQVALRLGYADPANFTHAFRRWTGSSPRTYRSLSPRAPS